MIVPSKISIDPLLTNMTWDLLVILRGPDGLPASLRSLSRNTYTIAAGIPSSIVQDFAAKNAALLRPAPGTVPPLTGSLDKPRVAESGQKLEYTTRLRDWIASYDPLGSKGAVSMLNLLAFKTGKHEEYLKYGKAFAESIGSRRGGNAKIVGRVIEKGTDEAARGWEEVALAHYPSILHFADMAASEDYQDVNHRHRVGSLEDTCILMTSELALPGVPGLWDGVGRSKI